jgi:hypothetical protein
MVMLKSDPRAREKPCLRCGYSLRHIADARHCPECGLSVWLSLSGNDDLEMSNPAWVSRLTLAAAAMALAHGILFGEAAWLLLLPFHRIAPGWGMWYGLPLMLASLLIVSGTGLLIFAIAEGRYPERARGFRTAAKVVGGLSLGIAGLLVFLRARGIYPIESLYWVFMFAHAPGIVAWAYVRHVAQRIPSRRIRQIARVLVIALILSMVWTFTRGSFLPYMIVLMPWGKSLFAWSAFLLVYPMVGAAASIFLARVLYKASKVAQKNWTSESAH